MQERKGVTPLAWIKSDQAIERHPKTLDLMGYMGWCLDITVGKLHRFWWWCLDYAEDGDLRKHNENRLGASVGLHGEEALKFVEAMKKAQWLDTDPYFRVHDWWDHAGSFLKMKYRRDPEKLRLLKSLYKQQPEDEDVGSDEEGDGNEPPPAFPKHSKPKGKKIEGIGKPSATFKLPEWVPEGPWNAYIEMRKSIKKPMNTEYAMDLAVKGLHKLRIAGHDPEKVLNQSVLNSWQGLFALKDQSQQQARSGVPAKGKHPCSKCRSTTYNSMIDGKCKACYDSHRE